VDHFFLLAIESDDLTRVSLRHAHCGHAVRPQLARSFRARLSDAPRADIEDIYLLDATTENQDLITAYLDSRGHHHSWEGALAFDREDLPAEFVWHLRVEHLDWVVQHSLVEGVASED